MSMAVANPHLKWHEEICSHSLRQSQKRRRTRVGLIDDMQFSEMTLPKGPSTKGDLFQWPKASLQKICDDERREVRLRGLMQIGFDMDSDYSGWSSEREICHQLQFALEAHGMRWAAKAKVPRFFFHRTCDSDADAQAFLLYLAKNVDDSNSHVMDDINNKISRAAVAVLDNMEPAEDATLVQRAECYVKMAEYVDGNRRELFKSDSTAPCLVHKTSCRLLCPEAVPDDDSDDDDHKTGQRMRINFAGNTCKGWSTIGGQLRFADPSEREHCLWLGERKVRAENKEESMFFEECTLKYPRREKLVIPLASTHKVVSVQANSNAQGFPGSRPRSLSAGLAHWDTLWAGPSSDDAIQEDFDSIFSTTMELDGDIFFFIDAAEREVELSENLRKRCHGQCLPKGFDNQIDKVMLSLGPAARLRYEAYTELRPRHQSLSGAFIADLDQWPSIRRICGPLFPCQLTHGTVFSWSKQSIAHGMEHANAQGWNVAQDGYHAPLILPLMRQTSSNKLKKLSGNGWCLPVVAAWMLYVWSNTIRRPVNKIAKELQVVEPDEDVDYQNDAQGRTS